MKGVHTELYHLDHVVHYLEQPEEELQKLKDEQLNVRFGGRHENRPTYNSLLHFGLSYVEFLSVSDKHALEKMQHGESSMIRSVMNREYKEGFVRFILRTGDIHAAQEDLEKKGVITEGPVVLQRKDSSGELISWKLLFVKDPHESMDLPYIIEWDEKDDARTKRLVKSGLLNESDHSHEHISQLKIAAANPKELALKWAYYFDARFDESTISFPDFQVVFTPSDDLSAVEKQRLYNGQGIYETVIQGVEQETVVLANGKYTFEK